MFITLLIVTFLIALAVSHLLVVIFKRPMDHILTRVIRDEISKAWLRYLTFAIYVTGISSGVRVWDLEKYVSPTRGKEGEIILELTTNRWILEVYRTVIGTLQGVAWMLLVFFLVALIAFVIVRLQEVKRGD
jgi:hypothetical protein